MAWAKGTATDFIDFLRKFRDYAAGIIDPASDPDITDGVQVPSGDRWAIQTNGAGMPALPGSGFATDGEVYLVGPGSDPDDEIAVGFRTYRNAGNNIYGWEMRGFTQFDDALTFETLPGRSPGIFAAFDDAAFDCWFWVSRRRIMALAVIGKAPILVHLGFIQQFASRSQYPYPLLISGSVLDNAQNFQQNHFGQSCLPDPCGNGAVIRWVDGSWNQVNHYGSTSDSRGIARSQTNASFKLYPHRDVSVDDGSDVTLQFSEDGLVESFSNTGIQFTSAEIGAYGLWPVVLHNPLNLIGRIEGMRVCLGLGLVTGDVITVGSDNYDVFANTWRTESIDFFAILRA